MTKDNKLNSDKLIKIYYDNDNKNKADNQHIMYILSDGKFSHGTYHDETHTLWKMNENVYVNFLTYDGGCYSVGMTFKDDFFKYNRYLEINGIDELDFQKYQSDPLAKLKFMNRLKQNIYTFNIKQLSIIFKACMSKKEVTPYIYYFCILTKLHEHEQAKYMPNHVAKLRKKLTDKYMNQIENF